MSLKKTQVRLTALAIAAGVAMFNTGLASAQSVPVSAAENSRLWFVELVGKPVADGVTQAAVDAEQARFRAAARAAGIRFVERHSYNTLFNGFSLEIAAQDRIKLAKVAGVRAIYPVEIIQAPEPTSGTGAAPDLASAITMTGASIAQNTLGLTGSGVRVGIIDSGVDVDHPAFGGTGVRGTNFPTARVAAGWDFVGDAFNAAGTTAGELTPVPDADPRDCGAPPAPSPSGASASGGHGTHVAGIVGANGGGIVGVAPGVTLHAYRVFGCFGSTSADIMMAAMERALADGVQVINQSIGSSRQWPQYPTAQATARLAKKGVVMVASIGNSGPGGNPADALYAAGAPGVGDGVIGVASYDNLQASRPALRVSSSPNAIGYNRASGAPASPTSGSLPLLRTGTQTTANDGCNPLPANSLASSAALIRRGTCSFYIKAINAQNASAQAVVLYNNQAGDVSPTVAGSPPVTIPVVFISQANGNAIDSAIGGGASVTLNWTAETVSTPLANAGLISSFSSFGLAPDLSFKPNLGAPGGSIYSSYPLELGSYASLSGTSMSSPHVAGAAALILQAVPGAALGKPNASSPLGALSGKATPPAVNMLSRMMNTAKPKNWSGDPALGFLDHTHRQGAGMLDVVAAVQTQQFVLPASIATGESQAGPKTQRLTLRNDAAVPVTYTMGHTGAVSTGPNTPNAGSTAWVVSGYQADFATVGFSSPSVVVPAGGTASVDVTITANPLLTDKSLYGGYITLTPVGTGTALQVPYAGFAGDYQSTQALRASSSGFPWVARLSGSTFSRCGTSSTPACNFTMASGNIPYVLLQFAHQARTVRFEALDAATSASRGIISEDQYLGRNSSPAGNSFFSFSWNGTTSTGVQPNGDYLIRVSVLKALGDAGNPAHWETWTSPTVTLARP